MKIVVFACDLYTDIAPAYLYMHKTCWPDCPYGIEFVTNSKRLNVEATVHLMGCAESDFGSRARKYIETCFKEMDGLMLLMMIDYLMYGVNRELVSRAAELCLRQEIKHVRLRPMPHPPEIYASDALFGVIAKGAPYSLSLQPGIWKAQALHDLCKVGESAHYTEIFGSARVPKFDGTFLSTRTPAIEHHNYYENKMAQGWAVNWVRENVPPEFWPEAAK